MNHTSFTFQEVPDGGDVVASCTDCAFEVIHQFDTGRVKVLNHGDVTAAHTVSYIPKDGLTLSMGISTRIDDQPPCGHEPGAPACKGST